MVRILLLTAILVLQDRAPQPIESGVATGQVLSPAGTPAAGVRVTARAANESGQPGDEDALVGFAQTDSAGRYRLENLPPGRYWISAGLVEAPTLYAGGAVTVRAGTTTDSLNFTLTRSSMTPKVSGRVIHAPGQHTQVIMISTEDPSLIGPQALHAAVAADGAFEFSNVRPSVYWMTVLAGDVPGGTQSWLVSVSDRDVNGIELTVPRRVGVAGTITVEGGGPPPPFKMNFAGESVPLQSDGTFQAQVPEGEHRVTMRELPSEYTVRSLTAGSTELLRGPLKVSLETPPSRIDVVLERMLPVKVAGRLTGPDAATALQPTSLVLNNAMTGARIETAVNTRGEFEFARVAPGEYSASWRGLAPLPGLPVIVPSTDLLNLEIPMPPMKRVTLKTVIEGGGWTPTAWFLLNSLRGDAGMIVRLPAHQNERSSELILPLGEFQVELAPPHASYGAFARLKSAVYGSLDLLSGSFKVSPADTEEIRLTYGTGVAKPWVKVAGRVNGPDAQAFRNLTVVLTSRGIAPIETNVNADGTFEFLMVPRGVYTPSLPSSGGASAGAPIDVRNSNVSGIELVVPR